MANATLSVAPGAFQSNDQKTQSFFGTLTISGRNDSYVPGGLPLDSVLAAALLPTTNSAPLTAQISGSGIGYIYQRIPSTGKMMILQVPPTGSLTTAAPLQELNAGATLSAVWADVITFEVIYKRNA